MRKSANLEDNFMKYAGSEYSLQCSALPLLLGSADDSVGDTYTPNKISNIILYYMHKVEAHCTGIIIA